MAEGNGFGGALVAVIAVIALGAGLGGGFLIFDRHRELEGLKSDLVAVKADFGKQLNAAKSETETVRGEKDRELLKLRETYESRMGDSEKKLAEELATERKTRSDKVSSLLERLTREGSAMVRRLNPCSVSFYCKSGDKLSWTCTMVEGSPTMAYKLYAWAQEAKPLKQGNYDKAVQITYKDEFLVKSEGLYVLEWGYGNDFGGVKINFSVIQTPQLKE